MQELQFYIFVIPAGTVMWYFFLEINELPEPILKSTGQNYNEEESGIFQWNCWNDMENFQQAIQFVQNPFWIISLNQFD